MLSMTGYAKKDFKIQNHQFSIVIKSLNSNKGLDINIKTPRHLMMLEPDIRQLIEKELIRGKIYFIITETYNGNQLVLDEKKLYAHIEKIKNIVPEHVLEFEEIKEEVIKNYIQKEKLIEKNKYISSLKDKYKICSEFFRSHSAGHSDMGDEIQKAMRVYGTSHWCTILDRKRIFHAPSVPFYDEFFFEDSQAVDNGMIVKCELDSGDKYSYSGNLIQFDQVKETKFTPTPLLGEHSFEILKEVGFQPEKINFLFYSYFQPF